MRRIITWLVAGAAAAGAWLVTLVVIMDAFTKGA
jgi:hypothetical protein